MLTIPRKFFQELTNWSRQPDRRPLLVRGARQVGKTWGVQQWCKEQSLKLISINLEEQPKFIKLFEEDLDVNRIVDELSLFFGVSLRDPGTVLFFDEIQKAPKAITALRYFYEKAPELLVIAAGSLIEFVLESEGLPVGRVQSLYVSPVTFTEFLKALGKSGLSEFIESYSLADLKPIPSLLHDEILSCLKLYYRIGGMPKAIAGYLNSKDMRLVADEQSLIIRGYSDDFRKYARKVDWALLETIFQKMGMLAGGAQVKFSSIDSQAKSMQIRRALTALQQALIIHKIYPTHTDRLPLNAHSLDKRFKISFIDIGLLHHLLGFNWQIVDPQADLTDVADGRFAEQFVAQEILTARSSNSLYTLHYWERPAKGAEAEVDFVVEHENLPAPIEVKSCVSGRLKSLKLYQEALKPTKSFVLSQRNVSTEGPTIFLPLYLAFRI